MSLDKMKLLTVVDHEFEDLELWYPLIRLREEGISMLVAGNGKETTYVGKYGVPVEADLTFQEARKESFNGILVPGGWAPDKLRRDTDVLEMVQKADHEGDLIGQICHAGWVLASAGILKGKTMTSTPGIKDDVINAGATWKDEPAVIDGNLVSSRRPPDLPAYGQALLETIKRVSKSSGKMAGSFE
ncbi:protease I [Geomicrobium halophilum]|uniref:Protease I n=1 Tax=Geomicrobium halophilum TaxID=549000 RepID=A0A841PXB8_9BACL|nr:type 1 glutamine amidotransferase domain-containing protein [Geomicrobium halophilum]MBB6449083.1 protease I [Geomicrobium halophilum]